jgi:hypothetical protein
MHECDFNTHKIGFYTRVLFTRLSVILTAMNVILHAECDLTSKVWFAFTQE